MIATVLESDLRTLHGAYTFLRDHDLSAVSTTSRLLRAGNLVWLAERVRDELDELRGAVAGTHGHGHGRDDIVLEAYQSLYWLMAVAVAAGDSYDDLCPHEALASLHYHDTSATIPGVWVTLDSASLRDAEQRRQTLRDGFAFVGRHCRAAGIDVAEAIQRDLRELRAKPYLAPYWKET